MLVFVYPVGVSLCSKNPILLLKSAVKFFKDDDGNLINEKFIFKGLGANDKWFVYDKEFDVENQDPNDLKIKINEGYSRELFAELSNGKNIYAVCEQIKRFVKRNS